MNISIDGITITRRTYRIPGEATEIHSANYATAGEQPLHLGMTSTRCHCGKDGLHLSPAFGPDRHVPDEAHAMIQLLSALTAPKIKMVDEMEEYLRDNPELGGPEWRERVINTITYIRDHAAAQAA